MILTQVVSQLEVHPGNSDRALLDDIDPPAGAEHDLERADKECR